MEQARQHHNQLRDKIRQFKEQFDVEVEPTGHEMTARENGGIHEEEYWVPGLIETKASGLNFNIGGWFSMDTREDEPRIYCRLSIQLNGEEINQHKVLRSRYHNDKEKWGELRWGEL